MLPAATPDLVQADKIYTEKIQSGEINNEYLPIAGLAEFTTGAQKLILGPDSPATKDGRVRRHVSCLSQN